MMSDRLVTDEPVSLAEVRTRRSAEDRVPPPTVGALVVASVFVGLLCGIVTALWLMRGPW